MTQSANADMLTIGTTPEESANTKARDREIVYDTQVYYDQFAFQKKYANGYVVNIGANSDGAGFRSRGGVNVDIAERDAYTGQLLPIDVFADARKLPWTEPTFDCAVLGEILEHMEEPDDAIDALNEAARVTKVGGKVVITLPHDDRGAPEDKQLMYAPGVFAYHHRKIERAELLFWIARVYRGGLVYFETDGVYSHSSRYLEVLLIADIAYPWGCTGTGIVAEVREEID
jgi:SAM-dependent methyltransferase